MECCRVIAVTELAKPAGVPCKHLCGSGCGIHETHPASCRAYGCLWQLGFLPDPSHRPDRLGLFFDLRNSPGLGPRVVAWEVRPGVAAEKIEFLRSMAKTCRLVVNLATGGGWVTTELAGGI